MLRRVNVCVCSRICDVQLDILEWDLRNFWYFIWYINVLYQVEGSYCSQWKPVVIWDHQKSKTENFVNTIPQDRNLGHFQCLAWWRITSSEKDLIVFGGGQRTSEFDSRCKTLKSLLTQYLKMGILETFDTLHVIWNRKKVIWDHYQVTEITISQILKKLCWPDISR